jgi:hypothetical protein
MKIQYREEITNMRTEIRKHSINGWKNLLCMMCLTLVLMPPVSMHPNAWNPNWQIKKLHTEAAMKDNELGWELRSLKRWMDAYMVMMLNASQHSRK